MSLFAISTLQLASDKTTPHFVGLPNRVQVTLGLGRGNTLMQHSVKKYERRNTLVRGTMNKDAPTGQSIHHPTKGSKILRRGSVEVHGDMHIRHTQACDQAPFVSESVIGCRQR